MINQRLLKFLDIASYVALLLTAVAVPLFFDERLVNFYIIPKQYVFISLVLIATLLFASRVVLTKKLVYRNSALDLPILAILLAAFLSAVFSANIYDSFFGRGEYFVLNFIFLFFLAVFYFLVVNAFSTARRWYNAIDAVLFSGGLTAGLFILKLVFKFDVLDKLFGGAIWNTLDKINSPFGIWMIIIFILSAGQLVRKELGVGRSLVYFFVSLLAFVSLILLSFGFLWWLLILGLLFILVLGISYIKEVRAGWLSVLFSLLILVAIFIAFGTPKSLQSAVPLEVSLGLKPSWSVTYHMLFDGAKNFLIGNGLGSFGVGFSKFRAADFNYDTVAWSMRFGQPYDTLLSFVSDGGIIFTLLFVFLALFVLGHIFQAWFKNRGLNLLQHDIRSFGIGQMDVRMETFLVAVAWVVLTIAMFFSYFGPVLWWAWWLLLALVISGLGFMSPNVIRTKEWAVEDTPQYSLAFSFILIVIMAAVIMIGVWGARLYYAETSFAKAMQSADYISAESALKDSVSFRQNSDSYHAALAQVYLMRAVNLSREAKPEMQSISNFLALAVNEAKFASDLSPKSVALWENLANMYENASLLVPEAREWALKAWQRASELEPSNPILFWRLGNNYSASGNWVEAVKSFQKAIDLKRDYLGAYVGLATAHEQTNQLDKAVGSYQSILPVAIQARNVDVLFNFGRLLYNRNKGSDRDDAEKLWLETIKIQPNYSNALYSLGLLYETRGERSTALQYYYKVKDLNPGNKDITSKIKSLVGE